MKKGHRYDYTLKDILQRTDLKFFELITGKREAAEILNVELPAVKQRKIDLLLRYPDGTIYHFELQAKNEKNFHKRMMEYAVDIYKRFDKCPIQHVIYIGQDKPKFITQIDDILCHFRYNVIDVKRDINCVELLQSDKVEDWIIAPLCAIKDKEKVVKEITRRISNLTPREQEDAFLKVEILLGLRKDIKEVFSREVKMPIRLKDNYFYKEAVKEGMEKGAEKTKRETAIRLYTKKKFSPEEISDIMEIPIEKIKKYLRDEGLLK